MTGQLNKANREIGKLKQDLKLRIEDCEIKQMQFNDLRKEKDDAERMYRNKIENLEESIRVLASEHEELRERISIKQEINSRFDEESTLIL